MIAAIVRAAGYSGGVPGSLARAQARETGNHVGRDILPTAGVGRIGFCRLITIAAVIGWYKTPLWQTTKPAKIAGEGTTGASKPYADPVTAAPER